MYPRSMFFGKNNKNITFVQLNIIIFTALKNCCLLHGRVCVMHMFKSINYSGEVLIKLK